MTDEQREAEIRRLVDLPYRKVIRGDAVDGFLAEAPDLPGCSSPVAGP